jgi:hypothetical protein
MKNKLSLTSALVLSAAAAVYGQDAAQTEPSTPSWIADVLDGELPDSIGGGKISLNSRFRYEGVNQTGLRDSDAFTIRNRFGFTTKSFRGFQGMIEGEDVSVIGREDNANYAGTNPGGAGQAVVADPEATEINRVWASYSNWDSSLKVGRQRIKLDNDRFIGNVGWRQNEHTFDAISLVNNSIENAKLSYSFVDRVNRILGDDHVAGNFDTTAHLINASYSGLPKMTLTGYAYLLKIDDIPGTGALESGNSANTYGASLTGALPDVGEVKLGYRAEFAWQTDAGNSPLNYEAEYYHLNVNGTYDRFSLGAGYEVLGTDNNAGFRTPLATGHAFNGWADVFLATPGTGLRDAYVSAGVKLPCGVPVKVVYHSYDTDIGDADLGQELDVVASKAFGKHWKALAKYAAYSGGDSANAYRDRLWLQVEFNF